VAGPGYGRPWERRLGDMMRPFGMRTSRLLGCLTRSQRRGPDGIRGLQIVPLAHMRLGQDRAVGSLAEPAVGNEVARAGTLPADRGLHQRGRAAVENRTAG